MHRSDEDNIYSRIVIVCDGISNYLHVVKQDTFLRGLNIAIEHQVHQRLRPGGNLQTWVHRGMLLLDPKNVSTKQMIKVIGDTAVNNNNLCFLLWGEQAQIHGVRIKNLNPTHYVQSSHLPSDGLGYTFKDNEHFIKLDLHLNKTIDWMN